MDKKLKNQEAVKKYQEGATRLCCGLLKKKVRRSARQQHKRDKAFKRMYYRWLQNV